jgi:hypothetical protein
VPFNLENFVGALVSSVPPTFNVQVLLTLVLRQSFPTF